jgi:hypothetical protein
MLAPVLRGIAVYVALVLAACRPSAPVAPADPHARARARLELLGDEVGPKLTALYAKTDGDVNDRAWVSGQLVAMAEVEQRVRRELDWAVEARLDRYESEYFVIAVMSYMQHIDAHNLGYLRRFVAAHGWFPISGWGEKVEAAAWLLVQHADPDPVFQREVLARIEPLIATGDTKPSRYALLFDRVARAEGRPQRYGSQGQCSKPHTWVADETEEPANVDARRASVGLPALKVYSEELSKMCP